jgi:hypothetical protein
VGQFLSMSSVIRGSEEDVIDALQTYTDENFGLMEERELTPDYDYCLVISEGIGGVTVLYPVNIDWDTVAEVLSERLRKPVFSFHIHDGDLWMYLLYEDGQVVDRFNPIPDYWSKISDQELRSWKGDPSKVARFISGLKPEQISNYLVRWEEVSQVGERKKAYPSDNYSYGDDWQLIDFMSKLGLDFPIDGYGNPHGRTFEFQCEQREKAK